LPSRALSPAGKRERGLHREGATSPTKWERLRPRVYPPTVTMSPGRPGRRGGAQEFACRISRCVRSRIVLRR
jgi:hypothetical protein